MAQDLPEIKAFLACDRAVQRKGKVSCEGIFTTINSLVFPFVHPSMSIYISYMSVEGEFDQKLSFLSEEGKVLNEKRFGTLKLPTLEQVVNVENLELPAPGRYWFSLSLNGREVKRIWLLASETPLRPPFTKEQIRELLANPRSVKKVRAKAECKKCGKKHLFQMNLDPTAPLDKDYSPFPESKSFVCDCGVTHDMRGIWASAWQMLGSLRPEGKSEESQ